MCLYIAFRFALSPLTQSTLYTLPVSVLLVEAGRLLSFHITGRVKENFSSQLNESDLKLNSRHVISLGREQTHANTQGKGIPKLRHRVYTPAKSLAICIEFNDFHKSHLTFKSLALLKNCMRHQVHILKPAILRCISPGNCRTYL